MRFPNNIPEPDQRRASGLPKPLASSLDRGTDYGASVRETTIANVSRNKTRPFLKADREGKMPKGV